MLIIVFSISLIITIWYTIQPILILWDSAMYIGIGKYMFSHGSIGVWETFRPPVLPIIYGIVWKLGIDPLFFGKILAVIFSMGTLWIVYRIGKRVSKNTGILAATLLSFTVIFITYTNAPLSDIPSTFFTTLAVLLTLRENYWLAGMSTALAFGIRFPQALILVPLCVFILLTHKLYDNYDTQIAARKILKLILGFFIPLLPYFIVNAIIYHNPLLPLLLAHKVASDPINAHGRDFFFYAKNLLEQNPLYALGIVFVIPLYYSLKKIWNSYTKKSEDYNLTESSRVLLISSISFLIIAAYFNFNTHLELRYSIAFLPFIALLTAYVVTWITQRLTIRFEKIILNIIIIGSLCMLIFICKSAYDVYWPQYRATPEITEFYSYFKDKPGSTVITTSPQMVAYSDITIIQAIDTWEDSNTLYDISGSDAEYIAVNNCALACEEEDTCSVSQKEFFSKLQTSERSLVFSTTSESCTLQIYKK